MASSITTTLGLNLTSFILYGLAFLITVAILAKYVWPPLTKVLDAKVDELESASRLEAEATAELEKAKHQADGVLKEARSEAEAILASAKTSAQTVATEAEAKARADADRIARDGLAQLENERRQAREQLRRETVRLVALASGNLIGERLDAKGDQELINQAIERAEARA